MKKKIAALIFAALMLAGCSGTAEAPGSGATGWFVDEVKLPNGTTVICVAVSQGGVSCDWSR